MRVFVVYAQNCKRVFHQGNAMSPQWNDIEIFLAVAERKTLSQAASDLGLSVATVTRRLDALESSLKLTLVRRTTRGAVLTEAGKRALKDAKAGARHLRRFVRVAESIAEGEAGFRVRVSSTEPMLAGVLAPRLPLLFEELPSANVEFEVNRDLSDLTWGDVDIAVRLAQPNAESLIGRRLNRIELGLYCSKRYLRRRDPADLDLANEDLLWLDAKYQGIAENNWLSAHDLEKRAKLRSTSIRVLEQACLAGVGIAPLPKFSAPPNLVEISGPKLPPRQPWIVFHRDTRRDERMQKVRDWIASSCNAAF